MNSRRNKLAVFTILVAGTLFGLRALAATDYSKALSNSDYRLYWGDLNGDGALDFMLRAKAQVVPVPLDDDDDDSVALIQVPPPAPTFVLTSSASGAYSFDPAPAETLVNDVKWASWPAALAFGSVHGNGIDSMLVEAPGAGDSFIIAISNTGTLRLQQQLTRSEVGLSLGEEGVSGRFSDENRDGRADLVVLRQGRVEVVLLADDSGVLRKPAPAPTPAPPPPTTPPPTTPPPTTPPPTCSEGFFAGGSNGGLDQLIELGPTSGIVQVAFNPYVIPDKLDITTQSGRLLLSTDVLVSGAKTLSFTHNPGAAGSTKVRVRVTGNTDAKTAWTVAASCPNQTPPRPPSVLVQFDTDRSGNNLCRGDWSFGTTGDLTGYFGFRKLVQGVTYTYSLKWIPTFSNSGVCAVPAPIIGIGGRTRYLREVGINTVTIQQYGDGSDW